MAIINARSPKYVSLDDSSLSYAVLKLFIYTGASSPVPPTETYNIRKSGTQIVFFEIAELIRMRKEMLSKEKMREMNVGDKVFFMSKGSKVMGTIRKKNIKRLVVDTEQGGWNVPASMLTLVEQW